jgi:hypothetical protein
MPKTRFAVLAAFAVLLAIVGCGRSALECDPDEIGGPPMSHDLIGFRGLWTSPVDSDTDPAHLATADNLAFYRPGVAELRRGFEALSADLGTTPNRLTVFEDTLIAHHGTATISKWTGSAWSAYSGTFTPPTGVRARFWQSEGSLFVSTTAGVYELDDPANAWRLTGSPPALQGSATLRRTTSESGGFTSPNEQYAYRLVWGYSNANDRLQLGAPSGRFLLTVPAALEVAAANISKTSGSAVVTVDNTTHGLVTGEYIDVTLGGSETNFVGATRFQVTVTDSNTFTYNDGGSSAFTGNPTNDIEYSFASRNADIAARIPDGITTDHFLQVYRSVSSNSASTEPNDALALVYERSPTNLEITSGSMTITDIAPDELRGAELYTSVGTILDAKHRPPACTDAVEYGGAVLCAATYQPHSLELSILGVGGATGLQSGAAIVFNGDPVNPNVSPPFVVTITPAATEDPTNGVFGLYTSESASQNVANTARSIVRTINAYTANTKLYAEYVSGETEAPGRIRIFARTPTTSAFMAYVAEDTITGGAFAPKLPYFKSISTIARAGSTVTVTFGAAHGFAVGQQVELNGSSSADFSDGLKTVASVPGATSFTYTESGNAVGAAANDGIFLSAASDTFTSNNTARVNGIMWALPGEPWAVPLTNLVTAGIGTVHRLIPSRDRLMVLTSRGTYQITGQAPNYSLAEYDTTLSLKGYDLAAAAGGRVYGLFDSGFAELLESARVADHAINRDVRSLMANAGTAVSTYGFAVPYESENMVLFFLPDGSADTSADQVYVLKTDTGDWTRWPITTARAAVVSQADDKLYIAKASGAVWKERKSYAASDHQDPSSAAISAILETIPQDADEPSAQKVWGQGSLTFKDAQVASGVNLAFKTDLTGSYSTASPWAAGGGSNSSTVIVPFLTARAYMRGTRWSLKLTHAVAGERWALQSLSVNYRTCSPNTNR